MKPAVVGCGGDRAQLAEVQQERKTMVQDPQHDREDLRILGKKELLLKEEKELRVMDALKGPSVHVVHESATDSCTVCMHSVHAQKKQELSALRCNVSV